MAQSHTSQKFKGRYRIGSARLQGYYYSRNGAYFVTICTKNREHFFGNVVDGKMELSDIGKIAAEEWQKTAEIRENVELGAWVVMPNHVHGILILNGGHDDGYEQDEKPGDQRDRDVLPKRLYGGKNNAPVKRNGYNGNHPQMSKISPTPNSIATIIRFFKRQTTLQSRQIDPHFAWQPRYHDRIIRSEGELIRVSKYILSNPQNWKTDDYF